MLNEEKSASGGKNIILIPIVAIAIGISGFIAGLKYQESKTPEFARNLPENIEQMRGQMGQHRSNGGSGLTTIRGEIISIDDSSVTVKLADDSSKIVILADSTGINKSEKGSAEDLTEGVKVIIIGQTNSDGSITAQNVQIGTSIMPASSQNNN